MKVSRGVENVILVNYYLLKYMVPDFRTLLVCVFLYLIFLLEIVKFKYVFYWPKLCTFSRIKDFIFHHDKDLL